MCFSMSMRARRAALFYPLLLASAGMAQTWTEDRVLDAFARESPQVAAARAQIAVARAEAKGQALYANPAFSFSREGAGYTEFLQAEQSLPVTGRVGLLRQAVAPAASSAEADADALVWQMRSDLRSAFYRLLAAQERENIFRATIADLGEVIRVVAAREKEGEGTRFDRLRWERELVEIRAELASAQAQSAQARGRLLEFLPRGIGLASVEGAMVPPGAPAPLDELVARALAARAEIRAGRQRIVRLRLEQRAAGRLRYPEPVIVAGLKRADAASFAPTPLERTRNGLAVGLTIPIPSFNRGQAELVRLQADQARVEAQIAALEHEIRARVAACYDTLALRRQALEAYRGQLGGRNEELLKMARTAYQEGAAGILELLDVFRLERQSEQRSIELGFAWREAQIELERATGQETTK
jgi:outer membrane protein, heavy metal efflux system